MERRTNAENTVEYFVTLREFVEEVVDLVWEDSEKESSLNLPTLRMCEEQAVPFIIAGLSRFWRRNFPFKREICFEEIVAAYKIFEREEEEWIMLHEPPKEPTFTFDPTPKLKSVVIAPKGSLKVTIENQDEEKEEDEDEEEMAICLSSDESLNLPEEEEDIVCFKCQGHGHVAAICPSKKKKSIIERIREKDPKLAEKLKKQRKARAKECRRAKRIALAIQRRHGSPKRGKKKGGNCRK